jgi:hypothetical protein
MSTQADTCPAACDGIVQSLADRLKAGPTKLSGSVEVQVAWPNILSGVFKLFHRTRMLSEREKEREIN